MKLPDIPGSIIGDDAAFLHHNGPVGIGEYILQAMLGENDGNAKLSVDLAEKR